MQLIKNERFKIMSIQYTDGTFSEALPYDKAFEKFREAVISELAKALFVGTHSEIEEIKQEVDVKQKLNDLSREVEEIKIKQNNIIAAPSLDDIENFGKNNEIRTGT